MWATTAVEREEPARGLDGISALLGRAGATYRDAEENIKKSMTP